MSSNTKLKIRKNASLDKRKARSGYFFVAPFLIGVILIYIPILIDSIWFSFNKFNASTDGITSVGFEYYKAYLQDDGKIATFLKGLEALILEVPAVIIFSLFIAVVLNQKMLGRAVFRAIFFVPVIISTGIMESINAATLNKSELDGGGADVSAGASSGNDILSILDVQKLFGEMKVGAELVTYVVQIVNKVYEVINYSGVQMLIFLAGLQSISPSIYEACQIEGATGWETFWKVTFPMISPMILVNAVYTVINAFTRSTNPVMKMIESEFAADMYRSSALAWMYFLVVILIIALVAAIVSTFIFYQRRD